MLTIAQASSQQQRRRAGQIDLGRLAAIAETESARSRQLAS
jgi:hypothetical protein